LSLDSKLLESDSLMLVSSSEARNSSLSLCPISSNVKSCSLSLMQIAPSCHAAARLQLEGNNWLSDLPVRFMSGRITWLNEALLFCLCHPCIPPFLLEALDSGKYHPQPCLPHETPFPQWQHLPQEFLSLQSNCESCVRVTSENVELGRRAAEGETRSWRESSLDSWRCFNLKRRQSWM